MNPEADESFLSEYRARLVPVLEFYSQKFGYETQIVSVSFDLNGIFNSLNQIAHELHAQEENPSLELCYRVSCISDFRNDPHGLYNIELRQIEDGWRITHRYFCLYVYGSNQSTPAAQLIEQTALNLFDMSLLAEPRIEK